MQMISKYTCLFKPSKAGDKENCIKRLETCIAKIREQMMVNKLKLNDDKMKLIIFWILDESGTAENKEELLFSHDKLLLTSILRPLHQVTEEMLV